MRSAMRNVVPIDFLTLDAADVTNLHRKNGTTFRFCEGEIRGRQNGEVFFEVSKE